jgi:hypothetical protein
VSCVVDMSVGGASTCLSGLPCGASGVFVIGAGVTAAGTGALVVGTGL